jgi:uncharacterized membrane protein
MKTKANLQDHPIHPMIVAFPITFYTLTPIAFGVYNWINSDLFWYRLGYFCCLAGVATALLAAVPGFIDWYFAIPKNTAAKTRGVVHMTLNVSALIIFAAIAFVLRGTWDDMPLTVNGPFWFSLLGVLITMAAGYQGWEMIATHKMGVKMTAEQDRLEPTHHPEIRDARSPLRPREV